MMAKLTDYKGEIVWHSTPPRPLDARVLIGDNSNAKQILGWEPTVALEEGLKKTIKHWKASLKV
jgi:hypothetical protein